MKKICLACALLIISHFTLHATVASDVLIDSFDTSQSAPGGVNTRNVADGSGILGGERDINTFLTISANGTTPGQLQIGFPNGLLTGRAGGDITYDGVDGDPSSSYFGGLGSVDLTAGGVNNCFQFDITSVSGNSAVMQIQVFSVNHGSSVWVNLPQTPGIFNVPFSAFQYNGAPFAYPADFQNVGYINFHFEMGGGDSVVINSITTTTVPEPTALALVSCSAAGWLASRRKAVK